MRARDEVAHLRALNASLLELLHEEREERTRLVNALLAKNSGDFKMRQAASLPEPIHSIPREERERAPQPMGM